MIFFRRVSGDSMTSCLHEGDIVVGTTRGVIRERSIVVAEVDNREVIKRVVDITPNQKYWLQGDNSPRSTDSRHYGMVDKSAILGIMKYSFPVRALDPPKTRHHYALYFGWVAAVVMICFAVVHLFRIDTFVPELQRALGLSRDVAAWSAGVIVCAEVFALPFLMRMKLSLLAQYISGLLGVAVPLFWTLVAIWNYGGINSTAQLGEFKELPSSSVLLGVNILWLAFAYFTLWALGYDRRKNEKKFIVTKILTRLSK
ncbi:MAG: S24/S26 family peptidase [Candidatus Saccharimonadales bacterium]